MGPIGGTISRTYDARGDREPIARPGITGNLEGTVTDPGGGRPAPPFGKPSEPGAPGRDAPDRGGRLSLLLGVPGLLMSFFIFPIGLVLDLAAIVTGVRALRRSGRGRTGIREAVAGIVLGSVGFVFAALFAVVLAVFGNEMLTYRECMAGANTISAREDCQAQLENAVQERLGATFMTVLTKEVP